jgi:hypothetical protein
MTSLELFGTRYMIGAACPLPTAGNDNGGICAEWQTPAETLRFIRRVRGEMRRELIADFRLRSCPKHRMIWESLNMAEACLKWQYFRRKSD